MLLVQLNSYPTDQSIQAQLYIYEEDNVRHDGYLVKFDTEHDWNLFFQNLCRSTSSQMLTNQSNLVNPSRIDNLSANLTKLSTSPALFRRSLIYASELNELIIYFQGIKLKECNINKAQDLLGKVLFVFFSSRLFINY